MSPPDNRGVVSEYRHLVALRLLEESREFTGRQWLAVVIALTLVATLGDDVRLLFGGLHALRDYLHAEAFAELDDGTDDGGIVVVFEQVLDEACLLYTSPSPRD